MKNSPTPTLEPPDQAIWGLPGTGKTHYLLETLHNRLQHDDVGIYDIVATTFRKLMAEDFRDRAKDTLPGGLPPDHHIRTTHSICYHDLDLKPNMVVNPQDREAFCDTLDDPIHYIPPKDRTRDEDWHHVMRDDRELGNLFFGLRSYCLNNLLDPINGWKHADRYLDSQRRREIGTREDVWANWNQAYEDWKTDQGLADFEDMLIETYQLGGPNPNILIWDEFQDITPLQLKLYNKWARHADEVLVAGDHLQTLYNFAGANPTFMKQAWDAADEQIFQPESHRFGPDLWEYARDNILRRGGYKPPELNAVGDTHVSVIGWKEYQQALPTTRDRDTFHLCRTNAWANQIVDHLQDAGIPYTARHHGWTDKHIHVWNGLHRLRQRLGTPGENWVEPDLTGIPQEEWEALLPCLPSDVYRDTKKAAIATLNDDEKPWHPNDHILVANLAQTLTGDPFEDLVPSEIEHHPGATTVRHRLRNTWTERDTPLDGVQHEVTTIHGSKGREADLVFLYDAITARIRREADPREEARVFFTGATRARTHLVVVKTEEPNTYPLR